jgi:hypothetical protein
MDFRQGLARLIGAARGRVKTPLQGMAARCSAALIGGLLPGHGAAPGASLGDDAPVCLIADQRLTITTAASSGALAFGTGRGLAYFRYLKWRNPTGLAHRLPQAPDVWPRYMICPGATEVERRRPPRARIDAGSQGWKSLFIKRRSPNCHPPRSRFSLSPRAGA